MTPESKTGLSPNMRHTWLFPDAPLPRTSAPVDGTADRPGIHGTHPPALPTSHLLQVSPKLRRHTGAQQPWQQQQPAGGPFDALRSGVRCTESLPGPGLPRARTMPQRLSRSSEAADAARPLKRGKLARPEGSTRLAASLRAEPPVSLSAGPGAFLSHSLDNPQISERIHWEPGTPLPNASARLPLDGAERETWLR